MCLTNSSLNLKPSLFKINLTDFNISFKLFVCAKRLVATIKSNFEYFLTIFFANLKLRGFLIVSIPLFIEILAVFVGSTPNTLGYSFFTNSKKEPSLLPTSKILGFIFLESLNEP